MASMGTLKVEKNLLFRKEIIISAKLKLIEFAMVVEKGLLRWNI